MADTVTGPSGGVLGDAAQHSFSRELYERHPGLVREIVTMGRHPRAGHDRKRWQTVNWEDYRAHVGIQRSRGPWRVEMAECKPDGLDAWVCAAEDMPHVPGWYTCLVHKERGLVMSDLPAEIAGCLPFLGRVAVMDKPWVLIGGLGLGIVPAWLLANTNVYRIDVVEVDLDIIGLVTEDPCAREKWAADPRLHVHWADALTWVPRREGCALHSSSCLTPGGWDAAWWDLWDTVSVGNLPSMHRLHRRFARRVGWQMSWERAECEAMRARGQTADRPSCKVLETGYPLGDI